MQEIKINFAGFWDSFSYEDNFLIKILRKKYKLILSDNPDYIICSMFGKPWEYLKYDGIRIFISGENYSPNFNIVDYAIGFDPLVYEDRFFRLPGFLWDMDSAYELIKRDHRDQELKSKTQFCNFIYNHDRDDNLRRKMLEMLSNYKKVDSGGTFLNNMEDSRVIKYNEKLNFLSAYKFTIAFESNDLRGFVTEKITDAFKAETIPIYMGDPLIDRIFNARAFINCANYKTIDDVVEEVIRLDNDDVAYSAMLNEKVFNDDDYIEKTYRELEQFLYNIFDQPKEQAYRRVREPSIGKVVKEEKLLRNMGCTIPYYTLKVWSKLKRR